MPTVSSPRARAWIELGFWVTFAGTGFALTFGFEGEIANYRYGAEAWPRMLFIGIAAAAAVQASVVLRQLRRRTAAQAEAQVSGAPPAAVGLPLPIVGISLVYVALLVPVGFFVATPPFLAGIMLAMGERRPLRIAAVAAVIYCLILLVFVRLLYVPLPVGSWPGFYEVGNFMLTVLR